MNKSYTNKPIDCLFLPVENDQFVYIFEKRLSLSNQVTMSLAILWQPGLRSIWEKYYEEAHALIYLSDAACPSRFEESKSALGKV